MVGVHEDDDLQFARRHALNDPFLEEIGLYQVVPGLADDARLPVDHADGPGAVGLVAELRDVPADRPVLLVGELLVQLVVLLRRHVVATQQVQGRVGMQEELLLLRRAALLDHHAIQECLRQGDDVALCDRHAAPPRGLLVDI